jgi:glutathione-regulated potassium-efflux system ancillary protein KefC
MNISHLMFAVAVMLLATAVAVGVAKKLQLGSIVALLVVGMVLGPHSPAPLLTGHIDEMQAVGEIGVMLLMFAVGLNIRVRNRMRKSAGGGKSNKFRGNGQADRSGMVDA